MRKIPLDNYEVMVPDEDGALNTMPYQVKESLVNCLLHPFLKLSGRELLSRAPLAKQIQEADGFVLVEEADYRKLSQAFEYIEGFTKNDMELVRRVLEAEITNVKEI